MPTLQEIMVSLRDAILNAFNYGSGETDFGVMLFPIQGDFDYANEAKGSTFTERIWDTVRWHLSWSDVDGLLALARMVNTKKPKRDDLVKIITLLEAQKAAPAPPAALSPPAAVLSKEFLVAISVTDTSATELNRLADECRPLIRKKGIDSSVVADQFHLSESEPERLAVVLALEHGPKAEYLQWLAERTVVENPIPAFYAAQALTTSALKLDKAQLDRVKRALRRAAQQLDNMVNNPDDAHIHASRIPVDISARKRQILSAIAILELRGRQRQSVLSPDEFDAFSAAMIANFSAPDLEVLFKQDLETSLRRVANLNEPMELIMCRIMVAANENGWEQDFVRSVARARRGSPAFNILNRFG